jgi:hypothetical protein
MAEWDGEMSDDRLMEEVQRLESLLSEASKVAGRIGVLCRGKGAEGLATTLSASLGAATKAVPVVRRRSINPVSIDSKASLPPESRREAHSLSAEERARALSAEVSRDTRTLSVSLRGEPELVARVAWWAGRARALLREFGESEWKMRDLVERVLSDLFDLSRRHDLEGIEALDRRWSMDDFGIYCAYQRHLFEGTPLELSEHEQQVLWNALVRALLLPGRPVSNLKASRVLNAAAASLGIDHPLVAEARVVYGERLSRVSKASPSPVQGGPPASSRSPESGRVPPSTRAPASVRAPDSMRAPASARSSEPAAVTVTRGRRAFLVGGSYSHPTQQSEIQQHFKFSKFKWLTATSGSPESIARLAAAIEPEAYDVVFLLPGSEVDELKVVVAACIAAEIPLVRLSSNYEETSFGQAATSFFG